MKDAVRPHPRVASILGFGENPEVACYLLMLKAYVARVMGWTKDGNRWRGPGAEFADTQIEELPDYVGDVRLAMEAEAQVPKGQYTCCLRIVTQIPNSDVQPLGIFHLIHANALKRCEAIALALGEQVE